jgi:hypothetical protein
MKIALARRVGAIFIYSSTVDSGRRGGAAHPGTSDTHRRRPVRHHRLEKLDATPSLGGYPPARALP